MQEPRYLYVMISKTHTGIGRMIRKFSRYTYNHVSLTLDPSFRRWVSFARYVRNTPLYGGFISEPVERYLADGELCKEDVSVRIFRLEISERKYNSLSELFSKAGNPQSGLVYNLFDITAATVGCKIPVTNAYTCLGFARAVLEKNYVNIRELDEDLSHHLIYEGSLDTIASDSGDRTDLYFSELDFLKATQNTLKTFAILISKVFCHSSEDIVTKLTR